MKNKNVELNLESSYESLVGRFEGGLFLLCILHIKDVGSFDAIYFWHPEKEPVVEIAPGFLELFKSEHPENLPFYLQLVDELKSAIPDHEKLLELLNHEDTKDV